MKNPFVMMAVMAAAMSEAFRENKMRDLGLPMPMGGGSRSRGPVGKRNHAGSKFILRAYKAKHGTKARNVEEAREWYAGYLSHMDELVRQRDEAKRASRKARQSAYAALELRKAA